MDDIPFQAIIIIVFLIVGAIRWVLENILGKKNQPTQEHWEEYDYEERADYAQPKTNSLEDLYEEARREILDRQNRKAPEPEVVREKLNEYQEPSSPPPLPSTPGKVRINQPAPVQKEEKRPTLTEAQKKAAESFQQLSEKKTPTARSRSRVSELLSSPAAARDAIVLAEILGKPKGAQ